MKKIMNKIQLALLRTKLNAESIINDQRGDTNFISIAIILVVVLAIAVVFIGFGKDIKTELEGKIAELFGKL